MPTGRSAGSLPKVLAQDTLLAPEWSLAAGHAGNTSVAVLFSGWLNVVIPSNGADARRHLVNVLNADVFVAGTFKPSDCRRGNGRCLLRRLRQLAPLTRISLAPMLVHAQLRERAMASPAFSKVAETFKASETFQGCMPASDATLTHTAAPRLTRRPRTPRLRG